MATLHDPGLDTPLRPHGEPAPAPRRAGRRASAARVPGDRGPLFHALRAGLRYIPSSWRALLFVVAVQLILGLTVIVPLYGAIASSLDHHPHGAALAGKAEAYDVEMGWQEGLHPGVWRDLGREHESLFSALPLALFWVCVTAWLFGAFAAGGFLGTAASGSRGLGAFIEQGGKRFGPMLRVGLLFALGYYVLGRLVLELWALSVSSDEFMAASQGAQWWGDRVREAAMVVGFLWLRLAGDCARAHLVAHERRGALRAFFIGLGRALSPRRWLLALAFGVPAFLAILGLAPLANALAGTQTAVLIGLFLLIQFAVLLRWSSRAGVLGAVLALEPPGR